MLLRSKQWRPARRGFTLLELLVVIGIITVLISLLAAGYMKFYSLAPRRNTETLIIKLAAVLDRQWQAVRDSANSDREREAHWSALLAAGGNDPQKAKDIWVQARRKQEFPTNRSAATSGVTFKGISLPGRPEYVKGLSNVPSGDAAESSACLFYALTLARRGENFDASSLSPRELLTHPSGVRYIADGWGNPLLFEVLEDPVTGLYYDLRSAGEPDTDGGSRGQTVFMNLSGKSRQQRIAALSAPLDPATGKKPNDISILATAISK